MPPIGVGKNIKGRSRATEHRDVLAEIETIAMAEEVDLVIVAGDLFDRTAFQSRIRTDRL